MPASFSLSGINRPKFQRLYFIHQQIKARKHPNAPQLAEKLEVHLRTIQRDLEFLRDGLNAPLEYSRAKRGYHYTNSFEMPPLILTAGEQVVLFLGQKLLRQCAGTPLEEPIRNAFAKICLCLPEGVSIDLDLWEQIVSFDVQSLRGDEEKLAQIFALFARALENKEVVEMCYYTISRDDWTVRKVNPYHLRYYQGAWYLIAYCHLRQEVRIFVLDRIRWAEVLQETFEINLDFSLEAYLGKSWGIERGEKPEEVVIFFDSYQARWIGERCWHETQEMERRPDGSLILRLRVSSLNEVKRWVLGFGSRALILAPASLRPAFRMSIVDFQHFLKKSSKNFNHKEESVNNPRILPLEPITAIFRR